MKDFKRLFKLQILILLPIVLIASLFILYLYSTWLPHMISHTYMTEYTKQDANAFLLMLIASNGLLFTALIIALHYAIIKPLGRLTDAAIAMTRGDYSVEVPSTSISEMRALTEAFTFMRSTVEDGKKRMEDAVTKATASNEAKSDFLANMSHELRTPMNGVLGMVEMLRDTPLNDEQTQFTHQIKSSAESLLTLLNDILDFSKIEANALRLEHIPFSTEETIQGVTTLLAPMAQESNLELVLDLNDSTPENLMGDPARLRQILFNLVGNAIKFTPHGQVSIHVNKVSSNGADHLDISIIDTGIGIPEDKLGAIFQKFTQADASNTRQFGGTGLGLAITQSLVELMGGSIDVESTLGVGSKFHFTFPCLYPTEEDLSKLQAMQQPHAHTEEHAPQLLPKTTHILLVEDDPINQEVARRLLMKLGFMNIDAADNGQDGVSMYMPDMHNLIFMDCQMPGMDGFEATEAIRLQEEDSGNHVPIIALTANAMVGDREKCLAAGMDEYLSKPIKLDKLKNTLSQWVNFTQAALPQEEAQPAATLEVHLMGEAPIDFDHLAMFTDGDKEQEKELFELFFETAHTCLRQLYDHLETSEHENWKAVAHRLKGAAANLGANPLSEVARTAEENSQGDAEIKRQQYTDIYNAFMDIETFARQNYGLT